MVKSDLDPDQDPTNERSQGRVRVLIVDDSALMRRLLSDLLCASPAIEIVGIARDGREAVLQAIRLKPDVITLDVEMPEVSGLDALPALLAVHDAPVVMVSALTQEGADITLQALELGAFDFMPKPERNQLAEIRASRELLINKVLAAAQSQARRPRRGTRALNRITNDLPPNKTRNTCHHDSVTSTRHYATSGNSTSSKLHVLCNWHLHRRSTSAEPDLSPVGASLTPHPGCPAHASAVHGYFRRAAQSL